ncbi:MAG: hypothetical protein ACJAT2_001546 [Bacteriovoracaceae bacterium]|jgi:hypothetical protein
MKTNDGIIHYSSRSDYLAKRPTAPSLGNSSKGAKALEEAPSKVDLSETAKEVAQKAKELPGKVKEKAQETVKAGKHLLEGASGVFKKALQTPGLSNLMPDLGGGLKEVKASKASGPILPKTLNQPAVIFINGYDLNIFDSETGLDMMASNIPRSKVFKWDQEEAIIDRIKRTAIEQPVILVGQGMGGDTAVEVSNKLNTLEHGFRKVDMLITMDSIGFDNDIISQNVAKNFNVISGSDYFFNDGPNIARNTKMTEVINELRPEAGSDLSESSEVQFMVFDKLNGTLGDAVRNRNADQARLKSLVDKILPS